MKDEILFWVLLTIVFIVMVALDVFLGYFLYVECNFTLLWSILIPILVLIFSAILTFGFQWLIKHL